MKSLFAVLLLASPCFGGDFINLTFDQPNLNGSFIPLLPGGPYLGTTADLLPGWSVSMSGSPLTSMVYSPPQTTGVRPITLRENDANTALTILGRFSLVLTTTPLVPGGESFDLRLSQIGTVPTDSAGLQVTSRGFVQGFVDGTKIGEVNPVISSLALWDVSPYRGKDVQLEIYVRPGDSIQFDIIGFTHVPEPSTWALLAVGGAFLGRELWRRR